MFIPKKYLTETVILVENIVQPDDILKILMQDKTIKMSSISDDPNFQYYKKLVDKARSGWKQGKNGAKSEIILDNFKLSKRAEAKKLGLQDRYTSLGSVLTKLKEFMDYKGQYNPNNVDSNTIQITTLEILCGYLNVPVPKRQEPEPEPDPDTKSSKSRDWTAYRAQKLANVKPASKALDEFYDEYYSQEYAGVESPEKDTKGIVTKLKSLDKILIPEFNKLGYNPEVNPFASFLKILIKKESDIFDKLTYNTYGAIHNSFIDKHITGNMLGQKFDETNILFCSDLYNKNGLDIVNYLDLQKQTLAAGKNLDIKNLIAKIFIQQDVSGDTYDEKINNLKNLKEPTLPGAPEAKLKSELEIRELYRHLFGYAAKDKETTVISEIVDKTKDALILDMVNYLIDYYERIIDDDDEKSIRKQLKEFNYEPDKTKTVQSKEILKDYKLKSNKTVLSLISKLLAKKRKGAKNKK